MNPSTTVNPAVVKWSVAEHGEHDRVERLVFDFVAGQSSVVCGPGCCCGNPTASQ